MKTCLSDIVEMFIKILKLIHITLHIKGSRLTNGRFYLTEHIAAYFSDQSISPKNMKYVCMTK